MTLDELRFHATRRASDAYCERFHDIGADKTEAIIRGVLDASNGALRGLKGEAYSYFIFQAIADDIAKSMIEKRGE